MRKAARVMPIIIVIDGIAGYYIRNKERLNVFNADTGLPTPGASETITLLVLVAAVLIVTFIFALRTGLNYTSQDGFDHAYGVDILAYPVAFVIVGAVWLFGTIKVFFDMNAEGALSGGEYLYIALSALSAISIALFAIGIYQDPRRRSLLMLSVIPALFMCLWLVLMYRQNAANPTLLEYSYKFLAATSAALGFYYTSGFVHSKPAPGKTIFFYLNSVFFCMITLADDHGTGVKLILVSIVIISMIHASMLTKNLVKKELVTKQSQDDFQIDNLPDGIDDLPNRIGKLPDAEDDR